MPNYKDTKEHKNSYKTLHCSKADSKILAPAASRKKWYAYFRIWKYLFHIYLNVLVTGGGGGVAQLLLPLQLDLPLQRSWLLQLLLSVPLQLALALQRTWLLRSCSAPEPAPGAGTCSVPGPAP